MQLAAALLPDLVLMDITLRGKLGGIESAAQIIAAQQLPVIFLTSYSDPATAARVKALNPAGYLIKPTSPGELVAAIEAALENRPPD